MRELIFMGKVLASSTHDLQNIFAIIKESGCLVSDIMHVNGNPSLKHGDKMVHSLSVIGEQVMRGRELLQSLNSFAHSASDQDKVADMNKSIKQASNLAGRMVRLKECTLQTELSEKNFQLGAEPFLVIESLFAGIVQILEVATPKSTITMSGLWQEEKMAKVSIVGEQSIHPEQQELHSIISQLGGKIQLADNAIVLHYPLAQQL